MMQIASESQQNEPTFFTGFLEYILLVKMDGFVWEKKNSWGRDGECTDLEDTNCTRESLELLLATTRLAYIWSQDS